MSNEKTIFSIRVSIKKERMSIKLHKKNSIMKKESIVKYYVLHDLPGNCDNVCNGFVKNNNLHME